MQPFLHAAFFSLLVSCITAAYVNPPILASMDGKLDVTLIATSALVNLGAANATREVWNSSLSAPVFRVSPGDSFRLILINNLASQQTNIHWHGLQIAPIAHVDDIFDEAAPSGSYEYAFQIPTTHPLGTFWYHSHAMNVSRDQVFSGMSGIFVIDDTSYLADYRTVENFLPMREILESSPVDHHLVLALSSQIEPTFDLETGSPELWRIANVGADQRFTLNFTTASSLAAISIVALDGQLLADPKKITSTMTLEAGQRADVIVSAFAPGDANVTAVAETPTEDHYSAGFISISVNGSAVAEPSNPMLPASSLVDLRLATQVISRLLQLSTNSPNNTKYMINNQTFDMNRVDFNVTAEQVEEWTVQNLDAALIHSFHVHQQPFQVITKNGTSQTTVAYQDVVAVLPLTTVVFRVKFPASLAGRFVFHCHVLEHEDAGMMGIIELQTAPPTPTPSSTTASPIPSTSTPSATLTTSSGNVLVAVASLLSLVAIVLLSV